MSEWSVFVLLLLLPLLLLLMVKLTMGEEMLQVKRAVLE